MLDKRNSVQMNRNSIHFFVIEVILNYVRCSINTRRSQANQSVKKTISFYRRSIRIELFVEESVKSETSGDIQRGLMAIIRCVRSRPHFFAEQLRKSMKVRCFFFRCSFMTNLIFKGAGTKESTLNRILITRSEVDLVQIKVAFNRLFNRELERDVSAETSGDYKKLLLEILKDPSQRTG